MDDVRFGLIGYGLFGSHYANAIRDAEGAKLVSICARSDDTRARAAEAHPDVEMHSDYAEMLAKGELDVVCVVAPNVMHHEMGMAVLHAGCHLLLEKPMALSLTHCNELIATAAVRGLVLAVGHELRLSSLWGGVRDLIEAGEIGAPQHALIELSRFPYRQGSEGWRYDIDRVGNWILEEPIHFFDLARWYLEPAGDPVNVFARGTSRDPEHPELRDNFSAVVTHENGAYSVVSQTLAAFGHHVSAKIVGTEGCIWAWWSAADARSDKPSFGLRHGLGDKIQEVSFEKSTGELLELGDEIERMVACARHAAFPHCSGADGRWSTLLCLAAQESVDSGQIIDVQEFAKNNS